MLLLLLCEGRRAADLNWQHWQSSQDFLGAGYNFFLSFLHQANLNLSPAYLENLFLIRTWKIKLSIQDNLEILNTGYYTKLTWKSEVEICLQELSNKSMIFCS